MDGKMKRGEQDGSLPYNYKCEGCGLVVTISSELVMKELNRLLAENKVLKERIERLEWGAKEDYEKR